MKQVHINLLDASVASSYTAPAIALQPHKTRRSLTTKLLIIMFGISLFTSGASVFSYQTSQNSESGVGAFGTLHLFGTLLNFSEHADKLLDGERDGRINILLLGIGGEGHDGANLTDTIMIASIDPQTSQVALVSLPRDLLVSIPGYGWNKINNAHAYGEAQRPGYGPELAAQVVSSTLHIPINYYVRVDFSGFERAVDLVGGVDVVVDQPFTDYTYPTLDKKYQTVHFDAGPQLLNGIHALQFVRSRHSMMNNEGSDFARSKRQQKVIMALKDRILSKAFLLNPQNINELLSTLDQNVITNMQTWEILKLAKYAPSIKYDNLITLVFDDGVPGYLHSAITDEGAYILRPNDGTFNAMSLAVQNIFDTLTTAQDKTKLSPTLIVKNGTHITGLASKVSDELKLAGFDVAYVGNSIDQTQTKNIIYDFTYGKKDEALTRLKKKLNANVIVGTSPETDANSANVDFLIVLGSMISSSQSSN
ncbi:MAG: LCP family protein [bacterium]|nr:LCP family protein [bacterium]